MRPALSRAPDTQRAPSGRVLGGTRLIEHAAHPKVCSCADSASARPSPPSWARPSSPPPPSSAPFLPATSAAAADSPRDGTLESRAVASCWEAKQVNPAAADGLYWLYTPALQRPQQFYCDMTTDGGGWVLIGRGRQGWDFTAEGQQAASAVGATVTGTAAFSPAHLTNDLVDGLLDNGAPTRSTTACGCGGPRTPPAPAGRSSASSSRT